MFRTFPAILLFIIISAQCLPAFSLTCPQISPSVASKKMITLENDIRHHNQLYYEKARPVISDAEYDKLYASLVLLEGCFPDLAAADSPTRTVGSDVASGKRTVKHLQPMLSLSSTTGPEAVEALLKRVAAVGESPFLVQPKVDGLPVELLYEAGRLVSAATRGDGRSGEDVTARVREIHGIPSVLTGTFPDRVVVRGEIYASLPHLKNYWKGSDPEKDVTPRHPRHVAAGVLQASKPDPQLLATLRLFPFQLVITGSVGSDLLSDRAALNLLSTWGFPVDFEHTHTAHTLADVQTVYRTYEANRNQQPFAMDGIVVKADDLVLRQRLGEGERAPFWVAAWKFPPDTAQTKVTGIRWTVGRTGRRTPIAELVPVHIGGVLVSRVSLHNQAGIARLDIATGDQVIVALVGDVIPQIVEVVVRVARVTASLVAPDPAPKAGLDSCLHDSPICRKQFISKAAYFVSKSGLNIERLGRKRLQKLVEAGLVIDLPSLFTLKAEDVATVPGFSLKTARRLTVVTREAGHTNSFRLVSALGVPGVGPKTIQRLAVQFVTLDALLSAENDQLIKLSTVDARAAKTLRKFFQTQGGQELLNKFRVLGLLL